MKLDYMPSVWIRALGAEVDKCFEVWKPSFEEDVQAWLDSIDAEEYIIVDYNEQELPGLTQYTPLSRVWQTYDLCDEHGPVVVAVALGLGLDLDDLESMSFSVTSYEDPESAGEALLECSSLDEALRSAGCLGYFDVEQYGQDYLDNEGYVQGWDGAYYLVKC